MIRKAGSTLCSLVLLAAFLSSAWAQPGDDYRRFFKAPETAMEYWKAMKFEIGQGQFPLAAEFLKGFMEKEPTDEELMKLEEAEGMSTFLGLRIIPKWSDNPKINNDATENVEKLIEGVTKALKTKLSDPQRITKLVHNLAATFEERVYAIRELRRSGGFALPQVVKLMQESKGNKVFTATVSALPYLYKDSIPALLAALEINDPIVQVGLIEALQRRDDFQVLVNRPETNPAPTLFWLAASPNQPEAVRKRAARALSQLLTIEPDKLPPARQELVREAERYYNHKVKYVDPKNVALWRWTGKELAADTVPSNIADDLFGLRYAQQALDVDPAYTPAQVMALSLAVELAVEQAGLDQPLTKSPKLKELLSTVNPDVVTASLERALDDHRIPIALGTLRALGDLGEVQANRARGGRLPPLVRAVNYPDRRVQFAAVDTILRIPGSPAPLATARVVEVLRRVLASDPVSKVLIADANKDRADMVAQAVKAAGYEPVVVQTGKEAFQRLSEAADIDALLLDWELPDPGLRHLLPQLRADIDLGQLPVFITVPPPAKGNRPPDALFALQRMVENYRYVYIVPDSIDPEVLKPQIAAGISISMGQPLSDPERKAMATEAVVWLKRLAIGEVPGYDVRPAEAALIKALRSEELSTQAVEAVGHVATRNAQRELANLVLNKDARPELRSAAAIELGRHIQQHNNVLLRAQTQALQELFGALDEPKLKANVALVIGALRPDVPRTADRLKGFVPAPPAGEKPEPGMKDKEKDKEKEKDKKEEKKDA